MSTTTGDRDNEKVTKLAKFEGRDSVGFEPVEQNDAAENKKLEDLTGKIFSNELVSLSFTTIN